MKKKLLITLLILSLVLVAALGLVACDFTGNKTPSESPSGNVSSGEIASGEDLPSDDETAKQLSYLLSGDSSYYIILGIIKQSGDITIPQKYKNKPVKEIANNAFSRCDSLTSIVIPSSVTRIGNYAFTGCRNLTIYCEVESQPSGWDRYWNQLDNKDNKVPVVWNCNNNDVASDGNIYYVAEGGIRYALNDGAATVAGQSTSLSGAKEIPSAITYKGTAYNVTSIGNWAFSQCSSLTSIEIPSGVTSIGDNAFYECTGLTSIEIPSSVTSIGDHAFYECTGLTGIEMPSSITSIGDYVFDNCSSLTGIEIPNGVTSIGNSAFRGCSSLTGIEIPSSVTHIGYWAFAWCSSLASMTVDVNNTVYKSDGNCIIEKESSRLILGCKNSVIPNYVISIGDSAFSGCSSLTSIDIPSSVTRIYANAFYECSSLTRVVIPSSITGIGWGAFSGCSSLTVYCEASSKPSGWENDWNYLSYKKDKVPAIWGYNNVTTNADYDYVIHGDKIYLTKYKGSETDIVVPQTIDGKEVVFIGSIFNSNTSITSIKIPSNITSIVDYAFEGCSNLTSIEIPNSVTSIGSNAFENCSSLTIYCEAESKPSGWDWEWNNNRPVVWGHRAS